MKPSECLKNGWHIDYHDMKFWWPHNERIIATLLAYVITGDEKYGIWHKMVHDYAYRHFLDKKDGEWFGYLHRDGTVAQTAKGNLFKGPYHLPRQELYCWKLLDLLRIPDNKHISTLVLQDNYITIRKYHPDSRSL